MSKFVSPHLGKITQSSGGVTFSTWKGINVMKAKAESVANPNTTGQQESRTKFKGIVFYARQILGALNITLKSAAVKKSQYNVFVGENVNFLQPENGQFDETQAASCVLSKGTLQGLLNPVLDTITTTTTTITWDSSGYYPSTSMSDNVRVYAYNNNLDTFYYLGGSFIRSAGTAAFTNPSEWGSGESIYIWALANDSTNNASNNQYLGNAEVA